MRDERKINIHDARDNNTDPQVKVKDTLAFFKHTIRSDEEKLRRKDSERDGVGNEYGVEEEKLEREEENKRRKTRRKIRRVEKQKKE